MKQLQKVFDYQGSELRTVVVDNEPWFVAKDVAKILGFDHTPTMTRTLEDDEKGVHIIHTHGDNGNLFLSVNKIRKNRLEFKRILRFKG